MAFRRPFASNGRFNRNVGNARQSNFNNQQDGNGDENEARELTGILWGNGYRDKQKPGAPVIQGFATINGQKLRVTGFFNAGPDYRDDDAAFDEKENYAAEINSLLLDAQKSVGAAFNLTFQDEDEWRAEREQAQGSGGNRGRSFARGGGAQSFTRGGGRSQERIPFNQQTTEEPQEPGEPEEDAPRPARRASKPAAPKSAKPVARKTPAKGKRGK